LYSGLFSQGNPGKLAPGRYEAFLDCMKARDAGLAGHQLGYICTSLQTDNHANTVQHLITWCLQAEWSF